MCTRGNVGTYRLRMVVHIERQISKILNRPSSFACATSSCCSFHVLLPVLQTILSCFCCCAPDLFSFARKSIFVSLVRNFRKKKRKNECVRRGAVPALRSVRPVTQRRCDSQFRSSLVRYAEGTYCQRYAGGPGCDRGNDLISVKYDHTAFVHRQNDTGSHSCTLSQTHLAPSNKA